MLIRTATEADIDAMHRIRMAVRENALRDPPRVQPADYRPYLATRGRGWVCELDGRIVGFAVADAPRRSIWALFVDPQFEGRGIGHALHAAMLTWLFTLDRAPVTLGTEPGTRAEQFYRRAGWTFQGPTNHGEASYQITHEAFDINRPPRPGSAA
ncbi:MAG TPA: GNAT family N-acetyltransferase [Steroidobacteraceae bacterium]|nr:GNAT family N-acetyltransferase [Steroidobacteraceae bacterium]HRX89376.1 GNAT family N-acetyltransferase [Steroidobacteraceae bacterium]